MHVSLLPGVAPNVFYLDLGEAPNVFYLDLGEAPNVFSLDLGGAPNRFSLDRGVSLKDPKITLRYLQNLKT